MYIHNKIITILLIFKTVCSLEIAAQIDSSYIGSFERNFSTRTYFINHLKGFENSNHKQYNINAPVSIGIGISWQDYSLAFSQGWNLLRDRNKGKTKTLQFQYYGYKRKYIYDISLHQHKGFYDNNLSQNDKYTIYPDIKAYLYSGSFMWIFNNKKFSYKAAFNQNERQLKSAGSFQLGGSIYYSKVKSDSTEVLYNTNYIHENIQFGFVGGYAHTWVLGKNWLLTGTASLGLNIGSSPDRLFKEKINIYPTINNRFSAIYNQETWSLTISSYFNRIHLILNKNERLSMNDVKMQMSFIKRFNWDNKSVNKALNNTKYKLNKFGL